MSSFEDRTTAQRHQSGYLVRDSKYQGLWRVQWPDGQLSDMANLARAKDALAAYAETMRRRGVGRTKIKAAGAANRRSSHADCKTD